MKRGYYPVHKRGVFRRPTLLRYWVAVPRVEVIEQWDERQTPVPCTCPIGFGGDEVADPECPSHGDMSQ